MGRIIAIEEISPMDSLSVENRALGCTEYQFYKLLDSLANFQYKKVICFNIKTSKEIINNVCYDSLNNISEYNINSDDYVLYIRPLSEKILKEVSTAKLIWWRHNLYSTNESKDINNCFNYTNNFVFPSVVSLNQFKSKYPKSDVYTYAIPNILYDKEFLTAKHSEVLRRNNYLVYASGWHKGIEKIVDIVHLYNQLSTNDPITLVIMHPGYGLQNFKSQLSYINEKLPQHSIMLGKQTKSEYALNIKQSFATIAPDFKETFGCVFAESLFIGTPVIFDKKNEALKELTANLGMCDYSNFKTIFDTINYFRYNFNSKVDLDVKYLLDINIELWKKILA